MGSGVTEGKGAQKGQGLHRTGDEFGLESTQKGRARITQRGNTKGPQVKSIYVTMLIYLSFVGSNIFT